MHVFLSVRQFVFVGCVLASMLMIAYASLLIDVKILFFPFILFGGLWLLAKPKYIAYVFILSTINFVGFINPETFIRLPGVFKINDLCFVFLMLSFAVDVFKNGLNWVGNDRESKLIYKIVFSFFLLTVAQITITSIRFDLPIISSLKVGRTYFFILFFFYLIQFFKTTTDCYNLLRFCVFICFLQFVFLILQLVGIDIGASNRIINLDVGGIYTTRVYIPAMFYALMIFSISLVYLLSRMEKTKILIFILIITSLSLVLSLTRTYWGALFYAAMIIFVLGGKIIRFSFVKYTAPIFLMSVPVVFLMGGGVYVERAISIFSELDSGEGNFYYRFTENPQRIEAFLDYPILGPGFVHADYAATIFNFILDLKGLSDSQIERALLLQTNDSGLITLLVSFGMVGVLWVFLKLLLLFRCSIKYQNEMESSPKALLLGNTAFIFSIWIASITTYGFMYADGIVSLSLSLYFIITALQTKKSQSFLNSRHEQLRVSTIKKIFW